MAERLEWMDQYNLNVPEIDKQHQQLVVIANEVYDLATGSPEEYKRRAKDELKKLVDYTQYHLNYEADFLEKEGYPQVSFHKMQHEQFIKKIDADMEKLAEPKQEDGLVLYDFLLKWLFSHIAKSDKAWSYYILSK